MWEIRDLSRSNKQAKMQVVRKHGRWLRKLSASRSCMCFVNCTLATTAMPAALCQHSVLELDVQGNSTALTSLTQLRFASGSNQVSPHVPCGMALHHATFLFILTPGCNVTPSHASHPECQFFGLMCCPYSSCKTEFRLLNL